MNNYSNQIEFLIYVFAAISISILFISWKNRSKASGLTIAYVMDFAILYVPGAWVYTNKWYFPGSSMIYESNYDISHVYYGFRMACYGAAAFLVGVIFYYWFLAIKQANSTQISSGKTNLKKLARYYLACGFLINICLELVTRNLPSINMVVASAFKFFVIGLVLYAYDAILHENKKQFYITLLFSLLCLPLYTMISDGFMSFAINALIPLFAMSVVYFNPKKHIIFLMIILSLLGASVFVNYMNIRNDLRNALWAESSRGRAVHVLKEMIFDFKLFNPKNQSHLEAIDMRLNQSYLVGKSIEYIEQGNIDYAKGKTLNYALIAMVPRVLWPEKPSYGGSMGIVADYTGSDFAHDTSVGVGQVMEFYINYGTAGVLIGFFILGFAIALFDSKAAGCLRSKNYIGFVYWFMPGLGFLNAIGLVAEIVGTIWISLVVCLAVNKLIRKKI